MAILAKNLAKQIGVSEATLSLVLNRKPGISQKTRARVERKVKELGYTDMLLPENTIESISNKSEPNNTAGSQFNNKQLSFVLFKDNGKLLGMNSFFPLILDGIETTARKHGYSINIINMDKVSMASDLQYIRESGTAGFVVFATELHEASVINFKNLNLPFVIFDNYFLDQEVFSVKVNNEQGTYLAVKYLYEMGHRRIGYLQSGLDINSFKERQKSARNAMQLFGLPQVDKYFYTIGYANEHAEEGMDTLLSNTDIEKLPTAFLADNDLVAIGAIQSLKKHGYLIPQDFSIIGYDDRPICTLVDPKLTTIRLPRHRFGAMAIELLIKQLEDPENTDIISVEVNGKLMIRNTVAPPKVTLGK